MSFVIEDGTGVAGANSYISAADATAYINAYEPAGAADWPSDTTEQEAALLVGCQSLELNFRSRFQSTRVLDLNHELSWPRFAFYDRTGYVVEAKVPSCVKQAQVLMALYHLQGTDVFPQEARDRLLTEETVRIGDLAVTERWMAGTPYENFNKVAALLWPVLKSEHVTQLRR